MPRPLTPKERDLVAYVLGHSLPLHSQFDLVEDMNDGGMGSLRFVGSLDRRLGKCIGEAEFDDADGVLVSVALNVDQRGELFELDLWKVDFSPLQQIAPLGELRAPALGHRKISD
ncbi:hypothetical protein JJB99_15535 [Bradyrhizobium diazoefficiens]|uniref:DUF6984 family protein n=1 Tax=Bradyrhizobium diazoefficiens TaxID=1355477 RepID=UPI00190E4F51|nr:hypothetical protein [Bradyrhizobium diazoefficiens]QQO17442.1 hypothetical protein JJB99_15535 [Bradyrhizobium diazoefficiens]